MIYQINTNSYLHTAYSNASDGSVDFSIVENDDATYIGQYTSASSSESTDPNAYVWNEIDENADQEYPDDDSVTEEDYDDELVDQLDRSSSDSDQATSGAQATGDIKNQTYHQPDEPSADEYVFNVGDLWYDTDDGNHIYRWDGSTWSDAQDAGIEAAQNAAEEAVILAYNAGEEASAKNAAYYQGTTPTGGTYAVNDVWFDTSNGGKMSYWNGSAWTLVTFGKDAITAGSITAEKLQVDQAFMNAIFANSLAAGIVKANNIDVTDLFSKNITATGTISGLKLRGESIDILAAKPDSLWQLITGFSQAGYPVINIDIESNLSGGHSSHTEIGSEGIDIDTPSLFLQIPTITVLTDSEQMTYTAADTLGTETSACSICVCKKMGMCQVFGYLKPSTVSTSSFIQVLHDGQVPPPDHGSNITPTVPAWSSTTAAAVRVRINAEGGLSFSRGAVDTEYGFSITYPYTPEMG